jgi:hypothetical protein
VNNSPDALPFGETRRRLTGTLDDIRNTLREYERIGLKYPERSFRKHTWER